MKREREELIRRCLRFTTKVVVIIEKAPAPAENMETAINCELPAKTIRDIDPVSKIVKPAFWASTPKAMPIGIYPRHIGHEAESPSDNEPKE